MMKDWTEAFKDKLSEDRPPLPVGELEVLEGIIRIRKRKRFLSWTSAAFVTAASVAIAIVLTSRGVDPAISPVIVDTPEERLAEVEEPFISIPLESESKMSALPTRITPSKESQMETVDREDDPQTQQEPESPISPQESKDKSPDNARHSGSIPYDSFDFAQTEKQSSPRRFSVSFSTGGNLKAHEYYDGLPELGSVTYQYLNHSPRILSYELSLRYQLSDRLDLASGICYYGTTSEVLRAKESQVSRTLFYQKAGYLGVPLHLDWYLFKGNRFSMYVGAGGEARKCVFARIGDDRLKDKGLYFSAIVLAGLRYEPMRHVGLFIEPQYSHSFLTGNPTVKSYITETPNLFNIKVGLSVGL